jgi:uncharacterized protein (UPF0333 family)
MSYIYTFVGGVFVGGVLCWFYASKVVAEAKAAAAAAASAVSGAANSAVSAVKKIGQ